MNRTPYTWNAEDYAGHSGAQYLWAREIIGKLNLSGSESVLDIGCGDGKITALMGSLLPGGTVTGIDSSAPMIALARKKYPPIENPNVSFREMDATRLTFKNQFDLAFSSTALHWIPDQVSVVQGVDQGLKKSGRIFFQMGGKRNAQDIIDIAGRCIDNERWQRYFAGFSFPWHFWSPDEYQAFFRNTCLVPRRLELIGKEMTQNGKDGLCGWIRTTWLPYTERIPEHARERFISGLADAYLREFPPDGAGLVHVRMVRLEIEAFKP